MISNIERRKTVLLTGGTGTFGSYLIEHLLSDSRVDLILLVRANSEEEARGRIESQIKLPTNVTVLKADLTEDSLGLKKDKYNELTNKITHILHAAANTRFNLSIDEMRHFNVDTTNNMLKFALECNTLERFLYLSSASVAGKRTGIINEDELEHNKGFNNTYQQSKYESELLLRKYLNDINLITVRPPLIFSKPHPGHKGPVNSLSHGMRLAKQGYLPIFPGTSESYFDIVDGEYTAKLIVDLLLKEKLKYRNYHITFADKALKVGQILKILEDEWKTKIPVKFCSDESEYRKKVWWKTLLRPKMRMVYSKTMSYLPGLAYSKIFDNQHLKDELGISGLSPTPKEVFHSMIE